MMVKESPFSVRRMFSWLFKRASENGSTADLDRLTRLARRFTVERQQVPKDLDELVVHNYLAEVPPAPAGQRFVVDRKAVEVRLEQMQASTGHVAVQAGAGLTPARVISDRRGDQACLLLLLAALALAPAGCRKQAPTGSATQSTQLGAPDTNQPLTGEVHPFMTSQLRSFIEQSGRAPTNFTELARTRLDLVPRAPPGMTWVIDYTTKEVKLVPR